MSRRDFFQIFVCFIFNVSPGSAPKRKNFDIQRNTRVGSGGQFTSNRLSCHHNYYYDHNYHSYILHFIHCYCLYCLLPPNFDQLNSSCTTQSSSKRGGLVFKRVPRNLQHNLLGTEYMEIERFPFQLCA